MTRDDDGRREAPAVSDDGMAAFRAALGADLPVAAALARCGGDAERAVKSLLDERGVGGAGDAPPPPPTGPVKVEAAGEEAVDVKVKEEPVDADPDGPVKVKVEASAEVDVKVKVEAAAAVGVKVKPEPIEEELSGGRVEQAEDSGEVLRVKKEEPTGDAPVKGQDSPPRRVKEEEEEEEDEQSDCSEDEVEVVDPAPRSKKRPRFDGDGDGVAFIDLTASHPAPYLNPRPIRAVPPPGASAAAPAAGEWRMVVAPPPPELDERPPDRREWRFFRKSYATGLSTCRGRKLLDAGEVLHFAFPSSDNWYRGGMGVSARTAAALAEIVRFSTNRSGEIGRLSPIWGKCLAPLVGSSTVMIQGTIVFPMMELRLMQEILLYVSVYIHRSSMYLVDPENVNHPDNPLRGLFKLMRRFGAAKD